MFRDHSDLVIPEGSTVLWRYLDLARFLFILEHKQLWFAKLHTLGDPYEGFPPKPLIDDIWQRPYRVSDEKRLEHIDVAQHNLRVSGIGRSILAVSCWHASEAESEVMWRLYGRMNEGLAIRTTFELFARSLTLNQPEVYAGMVQYVDFESYRPPTENRLNLATLKRSAFAHERELRAIVLDPNPSSGVLIPVDLDVLIAGVHVAPASPSWLYELVRDVCKRYELRADVAQSALLQHPSYMESAAAELSNQRLDRTQRRLG